MEYRKFVVRNFKGIDELELAIETKPRTWIHTLVGLNESGKSTILQAINLFGTTATADTLKPLDLPEYDITDVSQLIPKSKSANFNDSISVTSHQN